jgi:hypothetical protein
LAPQTGVAGLPGLLVLCIILPQIFVETYCARLAVADGSFFAPMVAASHLAMGKRDPLVPG